MEPASPEELDQLVAELLGDGGPPLLVRFDDGHTRVAGQDRPGGHWRRWAARSNQRELLAQEWDDPEEIQRRLDQEAVAAVQARRRWAQQYEAKLAGDVFHPGEERMSRFEAINKALKDLSDLERKARARTAIQRAVRGQTDQ
jgi:hypothetical protein